MSFSFEKKVRLLRELTRSCDDAYALRTHKNNGWSWRPVYAPLSDNAIALHLAGSIEIGSYALVPNGNGLLPNVRWIGADFDGKKQYTEWERDVQMATEFLIETGAPLSVNLSRSGMGAHIRVLFNEPVPAWMARRWFNAWLEEAGVLTSDDDLHDGTPQSFDRLIPPQDFLTTMIEADGNRSVGNLLGSPLNKKCAEENNGGSLVLDPYKVVEGDFTPDGMHWEHVETALNKRTWGVAELQKALDDAPGSPASTPPSSNYKTRLPIVTGDSGQLGYTMMFCEFMRHMRDPRNQTYQLWVALASQLHRFGPSGNEAFHMISSAYSGYKASETERKWNETANMHPIRCDTLVSWGYRCPHLTTIRCGGAKCPTYFAEHTFAEIL